MYLKCLYSKSLSLSKSCSHSNDADKTSSSANKIKLWNKSKLNYLLVLVFDESKRSTFQLFLSCFPFALCLQPCSAMQCNSVYDGRCCWVPRSGVDIVCLTSGVHVQHHGVRRLRCWNSGKCFISFSSFTATKSFLQDYRFSLWQRMHKRHTVSQHTN